jgi:c-di-GMP phosphodiesterase
METGIATDVLPLIALRPISDAHHAWVAMLFCADPIPEADTLAYLFGAGGLTEAMSGLPCVVPVTRPGMAVPPGGYLHLVPAATVSDPSLPAVSAPPECGAGPCLALGVDSFSAWERCRKSGFTWFAGNYALHPAPGMQPRNATRHALVLQLLTLITHDADSRELEKVVKQDPQLSYQLLRLVNSVAFSPGHTITSFNHAITMLGRRPMQRWLQLLLYARPEGAGKNPLLPRAAMRAALMEALFPFASADMRDLAFMTGMFSLLDVMLNESMAKLLAPLRLAVEVNRALLERSGSLGPALRAVEAGEKGDLPLADVLAETHIEPTAWTQALIRACHWAVRVSREV